MSMTAFISMDARLYQSVKDFAIRKYEDANGNNITSSGYKRVRKKVLSTFFNRYEAKVKELITGYISEQFPGLSGMDFSVEIIEDQFTEMPEVEIRSVDWCSCLSNFGYENLCRCIYTFLHEKTVYIGGNREWRMWEEKNADEISEEVRQWKL